MNTDPENKDDDVHKADGPRAARKDEVIEGTETPRKEEEKSAQPKSYRLWIDRQIRPCMGTTESSKSRHERADLPEYGIVTRVKDIVEELERSQVSLASDGVQIEYSCSHLKHSIWKQP